MLADLGATVIKVEPLSGDPYRRMPLNENMIRAFQGKKNIGLNLKSEEGLKLFYEMVRKADVVMHNYRPGVPDRLKIDYETLKAIKPDLVYVYAGSYGSVGPDRFRAAFNPTMGAFSGNSVFQSGEGNVPKGDQSPDPIGGSGVATGIMLGLAARVLTGKGQYIETSMMNSNVTCNSDDALIYEGKPPRQVPGKDQLGLEARYRLYECAEGWVFLAARFDAEFALLCQALGRDRPAGGRTLRQLEGTAGAQGGTRRAAGTCVHDQVRRGMGSRTHQGRYRLRPGGPNRPCPLPARRPATRKPSASWSRPEALNSSRTRPMADTGAMPRR